MGLLANFQCLMEAMVKCLDGIIVYILDFLVHLDTHDKKLAHTQIPHKSWFHVRHFAHCGNRLFHHLFYIFGTNNYMVLQNQLVKQLPDCLSAKLHKSSQHFCLFLEVQNIQFSLLRKIKFSSWTKKVPKIIKSLDNPNTKSSAFGSSAWDQSSKDNPFKWFVKHDASNTPPSV